MICIYMYIYIYLFIFSVIETFPFECGALNLIKLKNFREYHGVVRFCLVFPFEGNHNAYVALGENEFDDSCCHD